MVPVNNRKNYSAILTPKNCHGDTINSVAIRKFREETPIITLYGADTVSNEDGSDSIQNNLYPTTIYIQNKLCFAMTINKAQGQSINNLGFNLPQPVCCTLKGGISS